MHQWESEELGEGGGRRKGEGEASVSSVYITTPHHTTHSQRIKRRERGKRDNKHTLVSKSCTVLLTGVPNVRGVVVGTKKKDGINEGEKGREREKRRANTCTLTFAVEREKHKQIAQERGKKRYRKTANTCTTYLCC